MSATAARIVGQQTVKCWLREAKRNLEGLRKSLYAQEHIMLLAERKIREADSSETHRVHLSEEALLITELEMFRIVREFRHPEARIPVSEALRACIINRY